MTKVRAAVYGRKSDDSPEGSPDGAIEFEAYLRGGVDADLVAAAEQLITSGPSGERAG
jgi:hypothetical protein